MSYIYLSHYLETYDAENALRRCFADASKIIPAVVIIEPGVYHLEGAEPIEIPSDTIVQAKGATFYFPENLGENMRRFMFCGNGTENFTWEGGKFIGYVHDPEAMENKWEPQAHTVCIEIANCGKHLTFCDMEAENIAGPVIHVRGRKNEKEERDYAEHITVRNCRFYHCGMVMWDYGYLWQNIVFSAHYPKEKVEKAYRYMPREVMSSELSLREGKLWADVMPCKMEEETDSVTFFGEHLPEEIKRGKRYFVANSGAENGLIICEEPGGTPIEFTTFPEGVRLFRNMFYVFRLYTPVGADCQRKGAIDVTLCRHVNISSCAFDAYGDSMHILECENVVFTGNQILGARMGAFYIGFQCKNVTVTGNTVYGTNGSRVVSVERESEDVVIASNTFIGGGRGAWFNQPKNIVVSNNIFKNNTNKCEPNFETGRICYATGEFERYPELYFTTWQDSGNAYGPVTICGNIIETGDYASCAIAFNAGGQDIVVEGNTVRGKAKSVHVAPGCETPYLADNVGIADVMEETFLNPANVK